VSAAERRSSCMSSSPCRRTVPVFVAHLHLAHQLGPIHIPSHTPIERVVTCTEARSSVSTGDRSPTCVRCLGVAPSQLAYSQGPTEVLAECGDGPTARRNRTSAHHLANHRQCKPTTVVMGISVRFLAMPTCLIRCALIEVVEWMSLIRWRAASESPHRGAIEVTPPNRRSRPANARIAA
jgi:hypothetical protein